MECSIFGRKQNILQLLQKLKLFGYCKENEVQCPEAFSFCNKNDITNVKIVSTCRFLDFSVLKEKSFRCLAIQLKLNGYFFEKRKGYQEVFMRGSPYWQENRQGGVQKQGEEIPIELGEYETLELFEERMERKR